MFDEKKLEVTIRVPVADTSKALEALTASGVQVKEPEEIQDAPKALISLTSYGITHEEAKKIISVESIFSHDYDIRQKSIAAELLELFGEQHLIDALHYAYYYMNSFKMDWSEYKAVLLKLLEVHEIEDLICSPHLIRAFISKIDLENEWRLKKIERMEHPYN